MATSPNLVFTSLATSRDVVPGHSDISRPDAAHRQRCRATWISPRLMSPGAVQTSRAMSRDVVLLGGRYHGSMVGDVARCRGRCGATSPLCRASLQGNYIYCLPLLRAIACQGYIACHYFRVSIACQGYIASSLIGHDLFGHEPRRPRASSATSLLGHQPLRPRLFGHAA